MYVKSHYYEKWMENYDDYVIDVKNKNDVCIPFLGFHG